MTADPKINRFALIVAEFFYSGRIPFAPGTMGTLASLAIWIPAVYFQWPLLVVGALLIALFAVGTWAAGHAIAYYKKCDPPQVVIDEVVGQGLVFLVVDPRPLQVILAFLLFRFFDITKPWPIKQFERRFKDRFGIMIDDVVAGIFAAIALFAIKALWL